jgi:hypothetical protein
MKFVSRKLFRSAAMVAAIAGLAVGATAATASANGTNGQYQLCSRGTYASIVDYDVNVKPGDPRRGTSYIATPGQCVPIYMDGGPVNVYMIYDNGSQKLLGTAWYQANIATTGYKSTAGWTFF